MHKVLAGSLVIAGLVAGSVGIAAVNPLGVATAAVDRQTQSTDPSGTDPSTTDTTAAPSTTAPPATDPSTTAPTSPSTGAPQGGPQGVLSQVLQDLVSKGTITQAQADAIQAGVDAKRKELGPGFRFGRGFGPRGFARDEFGDVAKQLGMDPQALITELRSGKSLADVAKEKGIDPQTIIDSIVKSADAKIDDAVKNGKLDQTEADKLKQDLPAHISDMVNHQGFPGHDHGPSAPTPTTPSN